MVRIKILTLLVVITTMTIPGLAESQYAVGHRSFGGGTSFGMGYSHMDYQFPDVDYDKPFYLLPTMELKFFLSDTLSLDFSVPVVNIAASNALQDYFFFTAEAYLGFHPSAPYSWAELFVAPGFGVSYAAWSDDESDRKESGYAFHIPVRVGLEFNNQKRSFSFFVAVRPFFSLVHGGSGDNSAGGGGFLEVGLMAYSVKYHADRY